MHGTTTRPKVAVIAAGEGMVSYAGSRLLADFVDRTTLTAHLSQALGWVCSRRRGMI
jgi:hypothetical protein